MLSLIRVCYNIFKAIYIPKKKTELFIKNETMFILAQKTSNCENKIEPPGSLKTIYYSHVVPLLPYFLEKHGVLPNFEVLSVYFISI